MEVNRRHITLEITFQLVWQETHIAIFKVAKSLQRWKRSKSISIGFMGIRQHVFQGHASLVQHGMKV